MSQGTIEQRIKHKGLLDKLSSGEEAARLIGDGMALGVVTGNKIACPKTFLAALTDRIAQDSLRIKIFGAGPAAGEVESLLALPGIGGTKYGQLADRKLREAVNSGLAQFVEIRSGLLPYYLKSGLYGKMDFAVLEAVGITEEGYIIPSTSLLGGACYADYADKIIVEINTQVPSALEGMHDIYAIGIPPNREAIPLTHAGDRIGVPYIKVDSDKIAAIVASSTVDDAGPPTSAAGNSTAVAYNIIAFFNNEVDKGMLPAHLLPLQLGIGSIPTAFTTEMVRSSYKNLEIFSGSVGDGVLDLIDADKVSTVSATALYFSQQGFDRFYADLDRYKKYIVLRPVEIADCPELISRLGLIALNGALEVDIYGHVNSTHVQGSKIIGGVGGSCDFLWNAYLTIIVLPSTMSDGGISTIVPMVTHVDHPEHAIDVIVTEQGLADLRGLTPVEKAHSIITNCAHPDYKSALSDYLNESIQQSGGHEPHSLNKVFRFNSREKEK